MSPSEQIYDVCVIGSGAAGGALAYALSSAGVNTIVMEKGPYYKAQDYFHDEIEICRHNFFTPYCEPSFAYPMPLSLKNMTPCLLLIAMSTM